MRSVVHIDADAFFASVEQAADPRLRGRPIAVGGEQRGIIASASYEARRFGIYTPMPTSRARKLCPKLIILPGDYDKYERFSQWMFSYAYDFTPDVEVTSIDEGYLDLSANRKNPLTIARTLKEAIQQSLKITVSEGLGSNKLISQIASKLNKPAAFTEVPNGHEAPFLHPLPNRWLPGVGPVVSSRLNAAGLARIGQISVTPTDLLELLVGSAAPTLREYALGRDERRVIPAKPAAKSYSQQETFAQDQTDEPFIEATLRSMADRLMSKVRADGKSIRTMTVKVRYNDMDEDQCSESLPEPTDLETTLYSRIIFLLRKTWQRRVSLRLVSLKFSNVYEGASRWDLPLDRPSQQLDARRRLATVVDGLRRDRGYQIVLRGHDFLLRESAASAPKPSATRPASPIRSHNRIPPPPQPPKPSPARIGISKLQAVPLGVKSHYAFLDSTLSPEAIVQWAVEQELSSIALCDPGTLHGAVPFVQAAQKAGIQPILGVELKHDSKPVWLYVESAQGHAQLCRMISEVPRSDSRSKSTPASRSRSQPDPFRGLEDPHQTEGLICVSADLQLARWFPGRFYRALHSSDDLRHLPSTSLPSIAAPSIHYGHPRDRWKYDILQSIRTLTLLRQPHPEKQLDGNFHFPSPAEFRERFQSLPEALAHTQELAARCRSFRFPLGPPQFPAFHPPNGESSRDYLRRLVMEGAKRRYPQARLEKVRAQLETELEIIHTVGYEEYFLVVWDLLQECRRRGISWITRGSAADSLVCYCLEISGVCPIRFDLYFRRFLNLERMSLNKLPDIDVDFPHDRKDDVIDLLFAKYGPDHCAVVGGFSTFQARSAVGDVGKVMGISEHQIRRFTEHFPWSFGGGWERQEKEQPPTPSGSSPLMERLKAIPECRDLPLEEEPYRSVLLMAEFLDGMPRYAKMHPCGVVLSRQPIHDITPTFISGKGYVTTHHDMDGVEAMGLVKMDILAQGGLAVMRDVEQNLAQQGIRIDLERCRVLEPHDSTPSPAISTAATELAWDDSAIWDLISSGGARAVHHIESPAMTSLCRMCQVRDIDGLVAIVSVIRPGAANEQKKVRFTRRYQGLEAPEYPHPSLEPCLRSTFGLVVYEEHILQICEAFAGLNGGRADVLRRGLVKQLPEVIRTIGKEFITSARLRGHPDDLIQRVWELVTGFNGYAFCKAHSTAYGVEAYQSAWLKVNFPAEFMASVLTHGKGFYNPLVYVLECHRIGIPMLPPWINAPGPAFEVVPSKQSRSGKAIRVPVARVKHLAESTLERLFTQHSRSPFQSLRDFYLRVRPSREEMEALLQVGAFDGFPGTRTSQFWELQQVHHAFGSRSDPDQGWLLPPPGLERLPEVPLTEPTRRQQLEWETTLLGFTASGHPLELYSDIAWETYCPVSRMGQHLGEEIVTCGLVIEQRIHHQSTGEPMKFLTLCDWTGMVETELFAATYRAYGLTTVRYPVLEITARVEPFENGQGHTLRVLRAGKPRTRLSPRQTGDDRSTAQG